MRHGVACVKRINRGGMNRPSSGYHVLARISHFRFNSKTRVWKARAPGAVKLVRARLPIRQRFRPLAQNAEVTRIPKQAIPSFASQFLGDLQTYEVFQSGGDGGNR